MLDDEFSSGLFGPAPDPLNLLQGAASASTPRMEAERVARCDLRKHSI